MIGDVVERALVSVGVTQARVEQWLGAPCGCEERQQKLNQLGFWAARVVKGRTSCMANYLYDIMRDHDG